MKIRTVLGEYWLAASWMATSVVANTASWTMVAVNTALRCIGVRAATGLDLRTLPVCGPACALAPVG
jgi:hypothetical protein